MARTQRLDYLREQARQLADEVYPAGVTGAITDALATRWVNQAYSELHDLLVSANPDWYLADTTINTTNGTVEYAVPADFKDVRGVDLIVDGNEVPLEPYNFLDRGRVDRAWPPPRWNDSMSAVRYRIIRKGIDGSASRLRFDPDPGTNSYRLWYVQAAQLLVNDDDELDGVNGWEEYVIAAVAERMHAKVGTDPSVAQKLKAEQAARIQEMARKRDQGRPVQVADTRERYH